MSDSTAAILNSAALLAEHASEEAERIRAATAKLRRGQALSLSETARLLDGIEAHYRRVADHALLVATLRDVDAPRPVTATRGWWRFW